jgi:ankyrin repeat protein
MSERELPARPNLEHLKKQARALLRQALAQEPGALSRFAAFSITAEKLKLADALHVIAREHGFDTWPALKLHVEVSSEDPVEALTAAIRAKNVSLVRQVLGRHTLLKSRINEPLPNYGFDSPAIIAAVHENSREIIDALLDAGANINERSRWWAGSFGVLDFASPELAAYLISRGATIDIHSAARLGMTDRVRELLAANPQLVRARGGDGQMPLHFAATVEIAQLLVDSGADINVRDIDHESTAAQYMVSIRPHRHDVARYLVSRGAEIDIFVAAALGDEARVLRFLEHDPDIVRIQVGKKYFPQENPRAGGTIYIYGFGWGKTPHMVAHQFGNTAVFDLLMQRSSPWLRLAHACEMHDETMARQIVDAHPRLIDNLTPRAARRIIGAATRNNTRAVELLLANGWPAVAYNDFNQTPLHYAAWHGNLTLVNALLDHEVPVNVFETEHGGSPLAWALHGSLNSWERDKGDYPSVVKALLAAGAQLPETERQWSASEEVMEVMRRHPQHRKENIEGGEHGANP